MSSIRSAVLGIQQYSDSRFLRTRPTSFSASSKSEIDLALITILRSCHLPSYYPILSDLYISPAHSSAQHQTRSQQPNLPSLLGSSPHPRHGQHTPPPTAPQLAHVDVDPSFHVFVPSPSPPLDSRLSQLRLLLRLNHPRHRAFLPRPPLPRILLREMVALPHQECILPAELWCALYRPACLRLPLGRRVTDGARCLRREDRGEGGWCEGRKQFPERLGPTWLR